MFLMLFMSSSMVVSALAAAAVTTPTMKHKHDHFCHAFSDSFNTLDLSVWKHDITMGGGGNNEFQWYTNNRTNSYVRDGVLYIKPTLTADNIGADNVVDGFTMDIWGVTNANGQNACTGQQFDGCKRTSDGRNIINPIQSAMLRSVDSFSFKYGRVEVKARLPRGDWIWPAVWMLPKYHFYGGWPASGEIDIMESRGNGPDYPFGGIDTYASTLHWGPSYTYNQYPKTHAEYKLPGNQTFADAFHTFGLEWTPEGIKTYIDDPKNVVLNVPFNESFWDKSGLGTSLNNPWANSCLAAPFDQEFYLLINVAVGGTGGYFPENGGNKPWASTSDSAALSFWKARDQWLPTWQGEAAALAVDSINVWKLC